MTARALAPIPPGHRSAFVALGAALGVKVDLGAVRWTAWKAEERTRGFHVVRESRCGQHREFLTNEVRRVKVFRSIEAAERPAGEKQGEDA